MTGTRSSSTSRNGHRPNTRASVGSPPAVVAHAYLVPAVAPTVTTLQPSITGYDPQPRTFSPNGDGQFDATAVAFTLPAPATAVTLDVLDPSGTVVRSESLGPMAAGNQSAGWDGHVTSSGGPWAAAGTYLLRISAELPDGEHRAPVSVVDPAVMAAWGVTADLAGPTVTGRSPDPSSASLSPVITATLSEPVQGLVTSPACRSLTMSPVRP